MDMLQHSMSPIEDAIQDPSLKLERELGLITRSKPLHVMTLRVLLRDFKSIHHLEKWDWPFGEGPSQNRPKFEVLDKHADGIDTIGHDDNFLMEARNKIGEIETEVNLCFTRSANWIRVAETHTATMPEKVQNSDVRSRSHRINTIKASCVWKQVVDLKNLSEDNWNDFEVKFDFNSLCLNKRTLACNARRSRRTVLVSQTEDPNWMFWNWGPIHRNSN